MEISEEQIPAAEMERTMKAQEVILKAAAGKLKWWEVAEINEHGYSGLWDYRSAGRARSEKCQSRPR